MFFQVMVSDFTLVVVKSTVSVSRRFKSFVGNMAPRTGKGPRNVKQNYEADWRCYRGSAQRAANGTRCAGGQRSVIAVHRPWDQCPRADRLGRILCRAAA